MCATHALMVQQLTWTGKELLTKCVFRWRVFIWTQIIITDSGDMSLSKPGEIVEGREAWYAVVRGVTKNQTQLSD